MGVAPWGRTIAFEPRTGEISKTLLLLDVELFSERATTVREWSGAVEKAVYRFLTGAARQANRPILNKKVKKKGLDNGCRRLFPAVVLSTRM